jgi:hypothetical protein
MNKKKIYIALLCLYSVYSGFTKEYMPPESDEVVYIEFQEADVLIDSYTVSVALIASKQKLKRILISIPLGERRGLYTNETWLTERYLYFYFLGNEKLSNTDFELIAEKNGIQKNDFGEGEVGRKAQQKYVFTHGMELFRFDLQNGTIYSTGFILHGMEFAISPDDHRICVREMLPNTYNKLVMYNLDDGSYVSHDLMENYSEIGVRGDFIFHPRTYSYGQSQDTSSCYGDLQQIWLDLIWSFGDEYPVWWGKINWNTCTVDIYNKNTMKPNYYVSDGPLNIRSDPGLNSKKMFFYQVPTDTKVFVTEIGKIESIDGITAPWVWVWIEKKRFFGWVFSGYLKKIQ